MSEQIPVPPELEHLIEKRAGEDRRKQDDPEPQNGTEETSETPDEAEKYRRDQNRRQQNRREEDQG